MKKAELTFLSILVPLDFLLVFAAALTAYSLRFGWLASLRPVVFEIPLGDFLLFSAGVSVVTVLFLAMSGLYGVSSARRLRMELSRIFLAGSTAMMTVIVVIFFRGELFSSRFIVLAAWFFVIVYLSSGRVAMRLLQRALLRFGIGTHRTVLIGGGDRTTSAMMETFSRYPSVGYKVIKRFAQFDDGTKKELEELLERTEIDDLIVSSPDIGRETLSRILAFAYSHHLSLRYSADPLDTRAKNIEIGTLAGVPVVEVKGTRLDGWGRIFKRVFDVVVAALLIILTSPVMLLTVIAIKLDSKGPILFSRTDDGSPVTRIGEHGKPFRYFKFRSMKPGTHNMRYKELSHLDTREEGPLVKIKDDPRITRVGRFIRRYSIDELPELFLVLVGKMSLIGPRPHLPEEVERYREDQRRVLTIKPGITGMAQVSGRADLTFDEEVKLDIYYIENWSPWLDLIVLVKTPFVVLSRRGAY